MGSAELTHFWQLSLLVTGPTAFYKDETSGPVVEPSFYNNGSCSALVHVKTPD